MALTTTPEALDRVAAGVGLLFVLLMGYDVVARNDQDGGGHIVTATARNVPIGNQFETRGFECGRPDELLREVLWVSPGIVAASLLGVTAVNRAAWMAELCDRRSWP